MPWHISSFCVLKWGRMSGYNKLHSLVLWSGQVSASKIHSNSNSKNKTTQKNCNLAISIILHMEFFAPPYTSLDWVQNLSSGHSRVPPLHVEFESAHNKVTYLTLPYIFLHTHSLYSQTCRSICSLWQKSGISLGAVLGGGPCQAGRPGKGTALKSLPLRLLLYLSPPPPLWAKRKLVLNP